MTIEDIRIRLKTYERNEIALADFPGFRRAGVLVLLFPSGETLSALLTERTDSVEAHKGQISFPGGMMEEGDENIVATALRESREEVGLDIRRVKVLGILDDVPVPSQFIITPIVGYTEARPVSSPKTEEVAEVFDVPLEFFGKDSNARMEARELRGKSVPLWFYEFNGRTIWGATAAILRNLVKLPRPSL